MYPGLFNTFRITYLAKSNVLKNCSVQPQSRDINRFRCFSQIDHDYIGNENLCESKQSRFWLSVTSIYRMCFIKHSICVCCHTGYFKRTHTITCFLQNYRWSQWNWKEKWTLKPFRKFKWLWHIATDNHRFVIKSLRLRTCYWIF